MASSPEVTVAFRGDTLTLALPFGAQKELAAYNDHFQVLYALLASGNHSWTDLFTVLRIALRWSPGAVIEGEKPGADELLEELGLERAREVAAELLGAAYAMTEDWLGKFAAATIGRSGLAAVVPST